MVQQSLTACYTGPGSNAGDDRSRECHQRDTDNYRDRRLYCWHVHLVSNWILVFLAEPESTAAATDC